MTINLLMTPELWKSIPATMTVVQNFGAIQVIFPAEDPKEEPLIIDGDNTVLDGETDEIIKWLKPFNGFAMGVGGSPQFEKFEIRHIDKNL